MNRLPVTKFSRDIDFFPHMKMRNCHGCPAIEIDNADKKLHIFLKAVVCDNWMDSPDYIAKQKVHPFVQGGHSEEKGWIMIEFWCKDIDMLHSYVAYLNARAKTFTFFED